MTTLEIPAAEYHEGVIADSDEPRLSASIAHILVTRSPKHAWTAHPRLNPNYVRDEDDKFNLGNAAHAVLLEGEDITYVIHAENYRTKTSQEERDYARSIGKIPILARHRVELSAMVEAVREQLAEHEAEPPLFSDGKPEQTLLWEESGVLCKARLDWLRDDLTFVDDLKTRSQEGGAATRKWERELWTHGAHLQAAFYIRAVEAVYGHRPKFRWVCVETKPPYALTVSEPGGDILAAGRSDFEYALGLWRECIAADYWPSYPQTVERLEAPSWELAKREAREAMAA